jgi:hypothetical protein
MKPKQESERGTTFARGGKARMLPEQAASPQKPGRTGHAVKGSAPGKRAAAGGPRTSGHTLAKPAAPGHTAPLRKGR